MNAIRSETPSMYSAHPVEDEDYILSRAREILRSKMLTSAYLTSPDNVTDYLRVHLANRKDEHFGVVYLSTQNQVIESEDLFTGTLDSASVYPRVVVRQCLVHNSGAVIFYHNHPSGKPDPSEADIAITRRLSEALKLFDIRVLDHFIVGGYDHHYSFAQNGLI